MNVDVLTRLLSQSGAAVVTLLKVTVIVMETNWMPWAFAVGGARRMPMAMEFAIALRPTRKVPVVVEFM